MCDNGFDPRSLGGCLMGENFQAIAPELAAPQKTQHECASSSESLLPRRPLVVPGFRSTPLSGPGRRRKERSVHNAPDARWSRPPCQRVMPWASSECSCRDLKWRQNCRPPATHRRLGSARSHAYRHTQRTRSPMFTASAVPRYGSGEGLAACERGILLWRDVVPA